MAMIRIILLIILLISCSGCMSTLSRMNMCNPQEVGLYPGMRLSVREIRRLAPTHPGDAALVGLDFPFTTICDTLWLPLDLVSHDWSQKSDHKDRSRASQSALQTPPEIPRQRLEPAAIQYQ